MRSQIFVEYWLEMQTKVLLGANRINILSNNIVVLLFVYIQPEITSNCIKLYEFSFCFAPIREILALCENARKAQRRNNETAHLVIYKYS